MRCRLCRYICRGLMKCWGMVEEEYLIIYPGVIVLRDIKRIEYIAVELTGRPTIRVVSHL